MSEKSLRLLSKYGLRAVQNKADAIILNKIAEDILEAEQAEPDSVQLKLDSFQHTDPYNEFMIDQNAANIQYQKVLLKQNFVIIRQLDRIAALLEDK